MRWSALSLVPLFLVACDREPVAPEATSQLDVESVPAEAAGAQVWRYRADVPWDWVLTPDDFPCLTEGIHVSGTYEDHWVVVTEPTGGRHVTLQERTKGLTAVGMTTGHTYLYTGPMSWVWTSPRLSPDMLVFTFHNINDFFDPTQHVAISFHTIAHATLDPATSTVKVEFWTDDVRCR